MTSCLLTILGKPHFSLRRLFERMIFAGIHLRLLSAGLLVVPNPTAIEFLISQSRLRIVYPQEFDAGCVLGGGS